MAVAEEGYYSTLVMGRCVEVDSDAKLGYEAKELAWKTGLPHPVNGGNRYSRDERKRLESAESVDKILSLFP